MNASILNRKVGSDAALTRFAQISVLAVGCLLVVLGFRTLVKLGLTEAQLLLGVGLICSLFLQCGILYVLLELKRQPPEPPAA